MATLYPRSSTSTAMEMVGHVTRKMTCACTQKCFMYACGLGFPFVHESESITALSCFSRSITLSPSVFRPGLPDSFETDVDSDGDSVEDFLDADSDNDSVPDAMEGGFDSGAFEQAKK